MGLFTDWGKERGVLNDGMTNNRRRGFEHTGQEDRTADQRMVQSHVNSGSLPEGEDRRVAVVDQVMAGIDSQGHTRMACNPQGFANRMAEGTRPLRQGAFEIAQLMAQRLGADDDSDK